MTEQTSGAQEVFESEIRNLISNGEEKYSSLELFFLRRLSNLLQMRQKQQGQLNSEGLLLLDRSIFSVYRDAVELGLAQEAQQIIENISINVQKRADN